MSNGYRESYTKCIYIVELISSFFVRRQWINRLNQSFDSDILLWLNLKLYIISQSHHDRVKTYRSYILNVRFLSIPDQIPPHPVLNTCIHGGRCGRETCPDQDDSTWRWVVIERELLDPGGVEISSKIFRCYLLDVFPELNDILFMVDYLAFGEFGFRELRSSYQLQEVTVLELGRNFSAASVKEIIWLCFRLICRPRKADSLTLWWSGCHIEFCYFSLMCLVLTWVCWSCRKGGWLVELLVPERALDYWNSD